jgi:hypothetical protein
LLLLLSIVVVVVEYLLLLLNMIVIYPGCETYNWLRGKYSGNTTGQQSNTPQTRAKLLLLLSIVVVDVAHSKKCPGAAKPQRYKEITTLLKHKCTTNDQQTTTIKSHKRAKFEVGCLQRDGRTDGRTDGQQLNI